MYPLNFSKYLNIISTKIDFNKLKNINVIYLFFFIQKLQARNLCTEFFDFSE